MGRECGEIMDDDKFIAWQEGYRVGYMDGVRGVHGIGYGVNSMQANQIIASLLPIIRTHVEQRAWNVVRKAYEQRTLNIPIEQLEIEDLLPFRNMGRKTAQAWLALWARAKMRANATTQ